MDRIKEPSTWTGLLGLLAVVAAWQQSGWPGPGSAHQQARFFPRSLGSSCSTASRRAFSFPARSPA